MDIKPIRTKKATQPLSKKMIRNLHRGLGIPAEGLIQPYRTIKDAA